MSEKIEKIRPSDGSVFTVLLNWNRISENLQPDFVMALIDSFFRHHEGKFIAEIQMNRTQFIANGNQFHYIAIVKVERPEIAIMAVAHGEDLSVLLIEATALVDKAMGLEVSVNNVNDFDDAGLESGDDSPQDYLPHPPESSAGKAKPIEGKIDWTAFENEMRKYKP